MWERENSLDQTRGILRELIKEKEEEEEEEERMTTGLRDERRKIYKEKYKCLKGK